MREQVADEVQPAPLVGRILEGTLERGDPATTTAIDTICEAVLRTCR